MVDKILGMIKKEYRMKSVDPGVFKKLVIQGMNFAVESYDAVGLGRVSIMRASGLLGLMRRDTLVISPLEKDAPVLCYERIKAFGKYEMILGKNDLTNPEERLVKTGKKGQVEILEKEVEAYIQDYLKKAQNATECKTAERKNEIFDFVDEVIDSKKLSSDIFLANYGIEITIKLYHEVMFGTK